MQTVFYRVYNVDCVLLYAGISYRPSQRMRRHARARAAWVKHAHHVDMELYATREMAEYYEAVCIHDDKPLYNVEHPTHPFKRPPEPWPFGLLDESIGIPFGVLRWHV